jgi:hypothetical protein
VGAVQAAVIEVVLRGIGVRRLGVISLLADAIAQHADIPQSEREAAAEARVARRYGIPDQRDTLAVRMISPVVRGFERRKRPDRAGPAEPFRRRTGCSGQLDEPVMILGAAEGRTCPMPECNIGPKAPITDREGDRQPLYVGVQHELDRILWQCEIAIQNARDTEAIGITPDRKAAPSSHPRVSSVGANHQPRGDPLFHAVCPKSSGARITGDDTCHFGGSQQFGTGRHVKIEQLLLHLRMIEVQAAEPRWCRLDQIPVIVGCGPPACLMSAAIDQRLVNTEFLRLGRTPGKHAFPADSVSKLRFAFNDQDARSCLCEGRPEARTGEPAADDG